MGPNIINMYRTKTCGELRLANIGEKVTLAGWVQSVHNLGALTFVDLRDRYGITQLAFNEDAAEELRQKAGRLGREFVVQATGEVAERYSKNKNLPTGEIEILVTELNILNESLTPPFTIEEESDGGDDIRMKYRYLDLRRPNVRQNLELRHCCAQPYESGAILCASPEPPDAEATADGVGHGPLFPDCEVFPR